MGNHHKQWKLRSSNFNLWNTRSNHSCCFKHGFHTCEELSKIENIPWQKNWIIFLGVNSLVEWPSLLWTRELCGITWFPLFFWWVFIVSAAKSWVHSEWKKTQMPFLLCTFIHISLWFRPENCVLWKQELITFASYTWALCPLWAHLNFH